MGKSSASLKKKRSKKSSKARASSSKSKSRRFKSKKLRREVSFSSSDYDDSTSLKTSLSSSSEDSCRSRRARSSKRKEVKGRRKRSKRHSYSHDSSEDSIRDRKRKRAKIKNEYKVREKLNKKKKLRKEASVSSMSNGSWSCSTCQGGGASSDEGEIRSLRGRSDRKGKEKISERGRSGSERSSRYRARSCSSCSFSSESSHEWNEEKNMCNNNSRRLKSVITVTKEAEEGRELCRNETEEEIVDDHDYPCRSNDSNDGGSKRELDHHSILASKEKVDGIADFSLIEPSAGDRSYNDRNKYDGSKLNVDGAETSESREKKTSEISGASLNGDDLESILRQRALENLKKFRGKIQSSVKASGKKNKIGSDVNQAPIKKHELIQGKSIVNNTAAKVNLDKKTIVEEITLPVGRRSSIASSRNNERNLNGVKGKSGSVEHQSTCVPEKVIDAENPCETITVSTSYVTNNLELTTPESCHDSLKSHPTLNQTPASGPPQEKLVVTESTIDRQTSDTCHFVSQSSNDGVQNIGGLCSAAPNPSCPVSNVRCNNSNKEQDEVKEHSQFESKQTSDSHEPRHTKCLVTEGNVDQNAAKTAAAIQSTINSGRDADKLSASATAKPCSESSLVENSSTKLQGEANQGSQFEQKTMNVMRGGEMVQVSYKVYIPKKTPALARRQLKR